MRRYRKKIENIEEIPLGYMNIKIKSLVPGCNIHTSNHTKRKISYESLPFVHIKYLDNNKSNKIFFLEQ